MGAKSENSVTFQPVLLSSQCPCRVDWQFVTGHPASNKFWDEKILNLFLSPPPPPPGPLYPLFFVQEKIQKKKKKNALPSCVMFLAIDPDINIINSIMIHGFTFLWKYVHLDAVEDLCPISFYMPTC